MNLRGLRALVTGAGSSSGIGLASALALRALGADVVITGRSERILARATEHNMMGFVADLTDSAQATDLVRSAADRLGGLDVVVNNAGMTSIIDPAVSGALDQLSDAQWHQSLARNLDTAVFVTRAALPFMRTSAHGRVIVVSSTTGPLQAMRADIGYASAKAALIGFVRALALDEAPHGITVNAIAPGWIATESQTEHESAQGAKNPMGRSGRPEEVASAVAWLASEEAGFITGQMIVIDGGNSIAEERD